MRCYKYCMFPLQQVHQRISMSIVAARLPNKVLKGAVRSDDWWRSRWSTVVPFLSWWFSFSPTLAFWSAPTFASILMKGWPAFASKFMKAFTFTFSSTHWLWTWLKEFWSTCSRGVLRDPTDGVGELWRRRMSDLYTHDAVLQLECCRYLLDNLAFPM